MKSIFVLIVLIAGSFLVRAQTNWIQICNSRNNCTVYYSLLAGRCENPQETVFSTVESAMVGDNYSRPITAFIWSGPLLPGYGIIGVRVYSGDPLDIACGPVTTQDIFAPVSGPLPVVSPPVPATCPGCNPIQVFFETYCGNPTNIFCFF